MNLPPNLIPTEKVIIDPRLYRYENIIYGLSHFVNPGLNVYIA